MSDTIPDNSRFTATQLFAALSVAVALAGLAGAYVQGQISNLKEQVDLNRLSLDKRSDAISAEVTRREAELRNQIIDLQNSQTRRNDIFPTQFEFQEYKRSNDARWQQQYDFNKTVQEGHLHIKTWELWRIERDRTQTAIEQRLRALEQRNNK